MTNMLPMIGFIMTQFPFATAAMSLQSEFARDRFACLCCSFRNERPDVLMREARRQSCAMRPR